MEIGAPYTRGRTAEILCIMYKKPTTFVSRSQKWWGIIILNYCGCSGSHPYFHFITFVLQLIIASFLIYNLIYVAIKQSLGITLSFCY